MIHLSLTFTSGQSSAKPEYARKDLTDDYQKGTFIANIKEDKL